MAPRTEQRIYFIGPHGKRISTPSTAVLKSSPIIRDQYNRGIGHSWSHPIEITAVDGDVDDGTVLRFLQYAHRGDYTVPRTPASGSVPSVNTDFSAYFATRYPDRIPQDPITKTKFEVHDTHAIHLICHAQIYILASRYSLQDLRNLAIQKLEATLSQSAPNDDLLPAYKLAAYAYAHTPEHEDGEARLRQLAVDHILRRLERFRESRRSKAPSGSKVPDSDDSLIKAMEKLETSSMDWEFVDAGKYR